ncbi:MAG: hypothetical protein JWQ76_2053 [Ramlibacter sp.]|nr:hypothetical protein [Ramlibacter sp.]
MQKLMQWAGSQGNWTQSDFGGLPAVRPEADAALQRWQVVAGGLALVLSRVTRTERSARFCATYRLYQGLRRRLRQGAVVDASPELLSDVMHEIAGVADLLTTNCLRACFDASLRPGEPDDNPPGSPEDSRATSLLQSQPRPWRRSTDVPEWRNTARSDLSQERLEARASALRSSVAAARGTQLAAAR